MNTTNNQVLVKAAEENVTLDYAFTTALEDTAPLGIKLTVNSIRHPKEMKAVFFYTVKNIYTSYYVPLKGRA